MMKLRNWRLQVPKLVKDFTQLSFGALLTAVAINLFIASKDLVFGGATGLCVLLQKLLGLPLGVTNLAINVPMLIIGWKIKGRGFVIKSIYTTMLVSALLTVTAGLREIQVDFIVAAIFGGGLLGLAVTIVLDAGGSSGGTDLCALLLNKVTRVPVPVLMFLIDTSIMAVGLIYFGLNNTLYAIIVIVCVSQTVHYATKFLNTLRSNRTAEEGVLFQESV